MKRLLLLFTIVFSLSANCQDTIKVTRKTERIAVPNDTKDTLYVVSNMYSMVVTMWNRPEYDKERPVIVPVFSLIGYRKED